MIILTVDLLNCCILIVLDMKFNHSFEFLFFLLNIDLKLIESSLLIFDDYFDCNSA